MEENGGSMTVRMRTDMAMVWLQIGHASLARAQRARAAATIQQPAPEFERPLEAEFHSSMVAIAAAAFAVDAFYGQVVAFIAGPGAGKFRSFKGRIILALRRVWGGRKRRGRAAQVIDTLSLGFRFNTSRLAPKVRALYKLRRGLVHPESIEAPSEPHPTGPSTQVEAVRFSLEPARESLETAVELLSTCIRNPKPANATVVAWCRTYARAADLYEAAAAAAGVT